MRTSGTGGATRPTYIVPRPPFVHLHVHSEHSQLGSARVRALADRAAELEQPALALTDDGVLTGAIEFDRACRAQGLKPIFGLDVLHSDTLDRREPGYEGAALTLLATCGVGFRNLKRLSTAGFLGNPKCATPNVDLRLLAEHAEGVIVLTGHRGSRLGELLARDRADDARAHLDELLQIYGRENVYLELIQSGLPAQERVNCRLAALAGERGRPLVATADVRYLGRDDFDSHQAFLCVRTGSTLDQPAVRLEANEFYLKDSGEMVEAFSFWPEALAAAVEVAERCNVDVELREVQLPRFPVPRGETERSYLRRLAEEGLARRYGAPPPDAAETRLGAELDAVADKRGESYFLILWDVVRAAQAEGAEVGPGRGAAAGSLLCYCLGITDVDPIRHRLLFERLFPPLRLPDIDLDLPVGWRARAQDRLGEVFGADTVAGVATFGRTHPRGAIRDAGAVLRSAPTLIEQLVESLPEPLMGRVPSLDEVLGEAGELAATHAQDPDARRVIDLARGFEGLVRKESVHACAVAVGDGDLADDVPLRTIGWSAGRPGSDPKAVTQYPMGAVEEVGVLKLDFLGLRVLDAIQLTLDAVARSRGERPTLSTIPLDDRAAFEVLALRGAPPGFLGPEVASTFGAATFDELAAFIALDRPGCAEPLGRYVHNREEPDAVPYLDSRLRPILDETYGVVVYQEQVMEIARAIAGVTPAEADELRRAVGKKLREKIARFRDRFIAAALSTGVSSPVANELWDDAIVRPSDWFFSKAHAVSYALIAYRVGWLQAHYPVEYFDACRQLDAVT